MLLASAGLAGAELSPEEFNDVRNRALTIGFYYAGTSQIGNALFYTFCSETYGGQVAYIPMTVSNLGEARAALIASTVTFNICARSWKKPLDELLRATKNHLEEDEDGLGGTSLMASSLIPSLKPNEAHYVHAERAGDTRPHVKRPGRRASLGTGHERYFK